MSVWSKLRERLRGAPAQDHSQAEPPLELTAEESAKIAFGTGEYDESSGRRLDANLTPRYADDCFDEEFTTIRPQEPLSMADLWEGEHTSPDEGPYWEAGDAYTPTPTPTPY